MYDQLYTDTFDAAFFPVHAGIAVLPQESLLASEKKMSSPIIAPAQKRTSRLIALLIIIVVAVYPFLRLVKFPFNLPLLALAGLLAVYMQDRTITHAGFRSSLSLIKVLKWVVVTFFIIELLFDLLLQPLVNAVFIEPADYSAFSFLEGNTPKYLRYLLYTWLSAAIAEEVIYRGILIYAGKKLFSKTWAAVVLSSLVFASGHIYQGWSGTALTFLWGLAFSGIYLRCGRNIMVVILVHGLVDSLFLTLAYTGRLDYYVSPLSYLYHLVAG